MLKNKKVRFINSGLQAAGYKLQTRDFAPLAWSLKRVACGILCIFIFGSFSFAQEKYVYDPKGRRNPFIPLVTPDGRLLKIMEEENTQELILEGIIYDKNGMSFAMVNGEAVKIGDFIKGYQVLKIEPQKVIFIREGETCELELKKEE